MASIPYYANNPDDGTQTFLQVHVERAPDSGGVPGVFAEIASVLIDTKHEYTLYRDASGSSTSWYKHRFETTSGSLVFSDYSDYIQAGDSIVRQRVTKDIPADDIAPADWDRWITECLGEMYPMGIWQPLRVTLTPTTTGGVVDEYYALDQRIRDAFRVEQVDFTTLKHLEWIIMGAEWEQIGGELRLYDADDRAKYVVHGKAQFQNLGELTNDFFPLLEAMLAVKYTKFRIQQRKDFIAYMVGDPRTDIDPGMLDRFRVRDEGDVARLVAGLQLAEPAIEWSWGVT